MKGNIPYFDCYHVTRSGDVYSKTPSIKTKLLGGKWLRERRIMVTL